MVNWGVIVDFIFGKHEHGYRRDIPPERTHTAERDAITRQVEDLRARLNRLQYDAMTNRRRRHDDP